MTESSVLSEINPSEWLSLNQFVQELKEINSELIHEPWKLTNIDLENKQIPKQYNKPVIATNFKKSVVRAKLWSLRKDSIVKEEKTVFNIGIDLPKIISEAGKNSKYNIILKDGDQLIIPSKTDMIEVQGQVLSPSLIRYEPNKSLKEYINNSGGFSDTAKKSKIYVTYANGNIKSTKHFLFFKTYPKIRAGSTILVPEKIKKEGIGIQGIVGLTTSLATLGVLINTLLAN